VLSNTDFYNVVATHRYRVHEELLDLFFGRPYRVAR
jgi:hypothetical protein